MWRYLKAAFLVGIPVPGLGQLPVNAMAAFAVAALGFVEPSIWLAGLGVEAAVVGSLAFNPRFQKVVDARAVPLAIQAEAHQRSALIASLPPELGARLAALHKNSVRVLDVTRKLTTEPELLAGTEASLDKLQWIHLKLLVARDHLANDLGSESASSLAQRIAQLKADISANPDQKAALHRSQQATLAILLQRQQNLANREHLLKENESDLCRIEAQVALMRENAAIEGKPAAVDTEIELASDLRSPGLFGANSTLIQSLDEAISPATFHR